MTRKEKEKQIQKEDGKAFEVSNIQIQTVYLSPKYTLVEQSANTITSTGLLRVFDLKCVVAGPSFTARWDGSSRDSGNDERYDLDVDIVGVVKEDTQDTMPLNCRVPKGMNIMSACGKPTA
jgi:hypothetical protein